MTIQTVLYEEKKRRPRRQPAPTKTTLGAKVTPLRLTLRDMAVLEAIFTARYMTAPQIQALFWRDHRGGQFGRRKACQRRMRQLYTHGLVRRIEPRIQYSEGKKPLIYALAQGGAHLLIDELGIDPVDIDCKAQSAEENYPFLQHLLDTTEVRIAFTHACAHTGIQLECWRNERELKSDGLRDVVQLTDPEGKNYKAAVVPDAAFFLINCEGKQAFFALEIDRRTVAVNASKWEKRGWSRKVRTYTAYFASDAYQQRYGDQVTHVLTVTTGEKRLAHLKEATEAVGGGKRFWYTTFALATNPDQLLTGQIWQRAGMDGLHALLR